MKLSDAIVLGRILINPVRFRLLTDNGKGGCALGMAGVATGLKLHSCGPCTVLGIRLEAKDDYAVLSKTWPWLDQKITDMPCGCEPCEDDCTDQADIITHLFDTHVDCRCGCGWTLEQLIQWVRSVEPEESENNTSNRWEQPLLACDKEVASVNHS
jgi:hypothetical protein